MYTHFLDQDANVIDDLLVYRRARKNSWLWSTLLMMIKIRRGLNAVRLGKVKVDHQSPWAVAFGSKVILRNLRDPQAGEDMRVDIAIQRPKSRDVLLKLDVSPADREAILGLNWAELCEVHLDGINLVISRTGYTGRMGFELFVHPDKAVSLWHKLLEAGKPLGLLPCGLGAQGFPADRGGLTLYGHEDGWIAEPRCRSGWVQRICKDTPSLVHWPRCLRLPKQKRKLEGIVIRSDLMACRRWHTLATPLLMMLTKLSAQSRVVNRR